ncbi:helix-turn-helix domain-containing protein [Nucisporomicrobium flavum]|uniref:helix-turn-helix domain-containing protein n=1 Tax=Nucisporomicrobium flavum TaxID=2785915 RepID=UPI0018F2864D|nr:helix-turn-helix domain-containing protein [Nucisporomicrobium flavum]
MDEVLTIEQAATRIQMSERYVRRLVAERRIPFHKLGRCVRIKASDLAAHVEAGRVDTLSASEVWRDLGRAA